NRAAMDYLCILNAFEQNYYNRIKEICQGRAAASASSASSTVSTSSASCSSGPSTSSAASSTASSPTSTAREMAQAAAALAATQRLAAYQGHGQPPPSMFFHEQQHHQRQQLQPSFPLHSVSLHQPQHLQPTADPNSSNSLLWQPWRDLQQAAAMHHQLYRQQQQQQSHKEMRVTSKELPTTKWRRERRQRAAEYQVHDGSSGDRDRERERERDRDMDSPIDMSVSSGVLKLHQQLRASPPPPYREPLPGAVYTANSRPSVITQAPPKREPLEAAHSSDVATCDIDEHFRRSLGENYAALFAKKSPTPTPTPTPSPSGSSKQQVSPLAYGTMSMASPASTVVAAATTSHPFHQLSPTLAKAVLPMMNSPPLQRATTESPQPELPPPQEEPLPLSLSLNRSQTPPSPPPSAMGIGVVMGVGPGPAAPGTAATTSSGQVLETVVGLKRILDTPHHTPPRYSTPPPPAYGAHNGTGGAVVAPTPMPTPTPTPTPNQTATPSVTPTMPAIIRVKAETGLAAAAASSAQTPPASPTSSSNISIFTKTEASVDDHFAKALGDTWKKLQSGHKE
ncbi:hypothetical protein KR074_002183, partial [Drosophila pseudoananassae]